MSATMATRRVRHVAVMLLLTGVIAATASTAPAGAAPDAAAAPVRVTDVRVRSAISGPGDSRSSKGATASCQPGERVLSGGAKVVVSASTPHSSGHVQLVALAPTATTYRAAAVENHVGYDEDWALVAYAVCVPADPGLGLEVVERTSANTYRYFDEDGAYVNDVAAPCPAGKRLVGTGGLLYSPDGNVDGYASFQQLRPNQQGAYTFAQGVLDVDAGSPQPFTVRAYAVCANPIQGWHVVIDGTDYNDARHQTARAECPGQQIIGGGFTKGDFLGRAHVETMWPAGTPFQALSVWGGIPEWGTYDWNLAAWAICVDL